MDEEINVKKIMQFKAFRNPNFHKDIGKMTELIKAVNRLEINVQTFKIIRILIRFFRFPVLILFSPIYKRIELEAEKYLSKYQEEQIKTAGIVKAVIKQYNYTSLQFYFKGGSLTNPIELKEDSGQEQFRQFILKADEIFNHRMLSDPFKEDQRLKEIEDYLKKGLATATVQQQLCIQQYLNLISIIRYQIQKEMTMQRQSQKQVTFPKANSQIKTLLNKQKQTLIMINGPQQKSIEDKIGDEYLCCRPYFYQNEIINQPETLVQQYKNYEYPFDRTLGDILLKTICGFLNGRGGIIYIGIKEVNDTKKRIAVGQKYSENAKQDVLKYFRVLCEKISPEIVNLQLYKLEFVPLRNPVKKNEWVPGKYIIRLKVDMGSQKELYSFRKSDGEELFAFRTENEVLSKKMGQQIIQIYRRRLTSNEQKVAYIKHSGPCKPPEMGYQLCIVDSSQNKIELPWINKPGQSNCRSNIKKDKQDSIVQQYQKTFYCSLPKHFQDDFKKFAHKNGKNCTVFIQPRDQMQEECLEMIIQKHNSKDKIKKMSRLIQINNANLTEVEKLLEQTVLYNEFTGSRIGLATQDEVLIAIYLLDRANIDYHFIHSTRSNY